MTLGSTVGIPQSFYVEVGGMEATGQGGLARIGSGGARGATDGRMHVGMVWWVRAAVAASAGAGLIGLGAASTFPPLMTVPVAIVVVGALGVVIAGPVADRFRATVAVATGTVSLAATAVVLLTGSTYAADDSAATAWALPETAALFLLTLMTVRVSPPRSATIAAALSGIAVPCWLLRFADEVAPPALALSPALLGGLAAWATVPLLAVTIGLYLRALDERRDRAVADATREQRDQLAADLHDFVAHDISGMLAQAQSGQILAERDPAAAKAAFRRIEQSGMAAMESMYRSVQMLQVRPGNGAELGASWPTLADLPDVVSQFSARGHTAAHLDVAPGLEAERLPREVTATAQRLVVEALTNVRRHAPNARQVTVTVRRTTHTPGLEVVVADDGGAPQRPDSLQAQRHGGHGLPGLRQRVEDLGGTLVAGTTDPNGWRVAAFLPLPPPRGLPHG